MTTPDPRGFPRQSIERTICDTLADKPAKPADHWSFDSEADRKQRRLNRATAQAKAGKKIRISVENVDDAVALLNALMQAVGKTNK